MPNPHRILLASSNPHKLDEIAAVFRQEGGEAATSFEIVTLNDIGLDVPEPVEDQPTFEGNAALKARYYAHASGMVCLADDSGLEVDALGGEPGVRSARYSGKTGLRAEVDLANNAALLAKLDDLPREERTARFVCAMALAGWLDVSRPQCIANPDGIPLLASVRGTFEGRILGPGDKGYAIGNPRGRGRHGFGYDPLFVVAGLDITSAELTPDEKNARSHRGDAARKMWRELCRLTGGPASR